MVFHREARYWHRGYLPHIEVIGVPMFLTWNLIDAIPDNLRRQARIIANDEQVAEKRRLRYIAMLEKIADRGYGSCLLRQPANAQVVANTLRHWDGERYQLHSWCVMPNHVHVVLTIASGQRLDSLIGSWKKYSSARIDHRQHGPSLWHREYFDRFARSSSDTERWSRYTINNPSKAGLHDWPWVYPDPRAVGL